MSQLTKLREDHIKLAKMVLQLERTIARPDPPSHLELFQFRHDLMTTVIGHLKLEDWALYPRLIESGDEEISAKGRWFKEEMGGLAPVFVEYCDKWTASSIPAASKTVFDILVSR